jgi:DNA-binding transcriptional regulator YiaG
MIKKEPNALNSLINVFSKHLTKSDIYEVKALSEISLKILKKRIELNMNQKDFAKFMNVSQSMVSKWESGEYNFTIKSMADICEKLCFALKVTFDEEIKDYKTIK